MLFTLAFGYTATQLAVRYGYPYGDTPDGKPMVATACALTLGIAFSVTIYAFTTKTDFRILIGAIFVLGMTCSWYCIMSLCFGIWLPAFYSSICVILYGLYLLLDTKLIIEDGHHGLEVNDYVAGAMMLFTDIIMIFIFLLRLLGNRRR